MKSVAPVADGINDAVAAGLDPGGVQLSDIGI
jgi:hypothetical protein